MIIFNLSFLMLAGLHKFKFLSIAWVALYAIRYYLSKMAVSDSGL